MRKAYPSDITREQFEIIKHDLQSVRKETRPRKYDLYDIFCAVLYVLKAGCTWRALPHDFPNWNLVYHYFQIWSQTDESTNLSLLDKIMQELVLSERVIKGRDAKTSMIIVDSKSIKNTDTAEKKGMMEGKKYLE